MSSSVANKACILSESAPHSASWLSVVPSAALGLHLEHNEFLVALIWWFVHLSRGSLCPLCPDTALDPHNRLRDVIVDFCLLPTFVDFITISRTINLKSRSAWLVGRRYQGDL